MTAQETAMLVRQVLMTQEPQQPAMLVVVRRLTAQEAMALLLATAMVSPAEMTALLEVTITVR
jgi:hypothetical protein